jgi:hypothetical protein
MFKEVFSELSGDISKLAGKNPVSRKLIISIGLIALGGFLGETFLYVPTLTPPLSYFSFSDFTGLAWILILFVLALLGLNSKYSETKPAMIRKLLIYSGLVALALSYYIIDLAGQGSVINLTSSCAFAGNDFFGGALGLDKKSIDFCKAIQTKTPTSFIGLGGLIHVTALLGIIRAGLKMPFKS